MYGKDNEGLVNNRHFENSGFTPVLERNGNPDYDSAPALIKEIWNMNPNMSAVQLIEVVARLFTHKPTQSDIDWADEAIQRHQVQKEMAKREKILEQIKNKKVDVVFTKTDGSTRVMHCTLMPELLPVRTLSDMVTPVVKKKKNHDVCSVFDLNANQWRSFRWDSLIMVTTESRVIYKKEY